MAFFGLWEDNCNVCSVFTGPSLLCVCLCTNFSPIRTTLSGLGPTLVQYVLSWLRLQRIYFQRRSHSQVPRIKASIYLLGKLTTNRSKPLVQFLLMKTGQNIAFLLFFMIFFPLELIYSVLSTSTVQQSDPVIYIYSFFLHYPPSCFLSLYFPILFFFSFSPIGQEKKMNMYIK